MKPARPGLLIDSWQRMQDGKEAHVSGKAYRFHVPRHIDED